MSRTTLTGSVTAALLATCVALAAEDKKASSTASQSPADGLVQSALQAEVDADLARRRQLLSEALGADEGSPAAHWQLGQVLYRGKWLSIEDVARLAGSDPVLADYRAVRTKLGDDVDAQRVLARRCQRDELPDSARAHAGRLHELLPEDPEALQILGLSWYQGLLLSPDQIALRKKHDERAKQALHYWQPRLLEIRKQMDSKDNRQSTLGWHALRALQDSSSIGALEAVFSKYRHDASLEVVKVIGRMDGRAATDSLVRHALLSKWDDVRKAACGELRQRSAVGYVPQLIDALTSPVQTRLEVVQDGNEVRLREIVEQEDINSKKQKVLETRVPLIVPNPNLASIVNAAALETFAHAQMTERALKGNNRRREELNDEIYAVLEQSTGQSLPRDPDAWNLWWRKNNFMAVKPKTTFTETDTQYVDIPYTPYVPPSIPVYAARIHGACFALGTKVWALDGPVAIETVQIGDRVLAQDPFTGELTYKPVMETTIGHTELIAIEVGKEKIVATPGHVFWVSGNGWRMAHDLKVGDRLHCVDGWAKIVGLRDLPAADTRNLVVADFGTYFVGDSRLLVHDVTMLQPYAGKVPGDTPSEALAAQLGDSKLSPK